jgi:hypothetical protein
MTQRAAENYPEEKLFLLRKIFHGDGFILSKKNAKVGSAKQDIFTLA